MQQSARANGKLILVGEHAVVYGTPAIAAGINLGARAAAEVVSGDSWLALGANQTAQAAAAATADGLRPAAAADPTRVFSQDDSETAQAFRALRSVLETAGGGGALQGLGVSVELDIPAGVGLGASAAIAVAVARACCGALGIPEDPALVAEAAAAWESVFHGNASGVDVAAAMSSGPIWFVREQAPSALACAVPLYLAVGLAGPPASTSRMVSLVRERRHSDLAAFGAALARITILAETARAALRQGDLPALGAAFNACQTELEGFGVSTGSIRAACDIARAAGALGAKLTGAGGGGAVIALCAGDTEPVLNAWSAQGIRGFHAQVGSTGSVRVVPLSEAP